MIGWNVVVTAEEHHFAQACQFLESFGPFSKTNFYNVLLLKVEDIDNFLKRVHHIQDNDPASGHRLTRVMPVSTTFTFQSPEEFELKAREAITQWSELLNNCNFHVRMHRRGFKGRMKSQEEELFLDHVILEQLSEHGQSAKIDFDKPDFILAVETIGQQAGLSLWSREDLRCYPLLKLD